MLYTHICFVLSFGETIIRGGGNNEWKMTPEHRQHCRYMKYECVKGVRLHKVEKRETETETVSEAEK